MENHPIVYGIGNPIVDIIFQATDEDIEILGLQKGSMSLVTKKQQDYIINYFKLENSFMMPGGSAPNTILACNGLGTPSVLSGKIGNDKFGKIYLDQINQYNVLPKCSN
jgi:Sugar kinases, ribokinase family